MRADQLIKDLKSEDCFLGVFARNTLPNEVKYPCGLIVNTDKISDPGTHWVCIYIDGNGIGEYFDPFGTPALYPEFEDFLFNNCINGFFENKILIQCTDCVTCGEYCEAYLTIRMNGCFYKDFISLFTSDPDKNDVLIKTYKEILFNYLKFI